MEIQLSFKVDGQHVVRTDKHNVLASGTQNYLIAKFEFSDEWNELNGKIAIFRYKGKNYIVELDENLTCTIPWEVIMPGRFYVSVIAGELYTSDMCEVSVASSAYGAETIATTEPTAAIYSQLATRIDELAQKIESLSASLAQ